MQKLTTNLSTGLTTSEVDQRIKAGEVNTSPGTKTLSIRQILFKNVFTFFNLVNFILAALLIFVHSYRNLLFLIIVIANIAIGSYQEIKAKKTLDRLSLLNKKDVNVLRNGRIVKISENQIVLGDVLLLSSGDQIPADAVLETGSLQVNDSLLTGESTPVLKKAGDQLLSGSVVIGGRAKAVVNEVGDNSFTGKLAREAKKVRVRQSEIQSSLDSLIHIIALALIPIGLLLFAKDYFILHAGFPYAIESTVAALIAMIPQGLVLLISMVFAAAVIKLAKDHTLVQRMSTVPTLAEIDMLCLDKTGTITEGNLDLIELFPLGETDVSETKHILKNTMSNFDDDDPVIDAIVRYLKDEKVQSGVTITDTVPFSSLHNYSGVSYKRDGKLTSVVLGAPDFILGDKADTIEKELNRFTYAGDYVLLMATSNQPFKDGDLPEDIKATALIVYRDKLRPSVPAALKFFLDQGVPIKIVSGDNPITASATAKRAGLPGYDHYCNMIDYKTYGEVKKAVNEITVFGNCLPNQKEQVVQALQQEGYTVGYVGNGVNDILALKEANVSAAVADGAQAACVVSDLVLLNSSFVPLPKIVLEGRKLINNLERSAVLYLSKTIFATLIAVLYLFLAYSYPFEPIQFSLVSAVTIGIPSFVLAFEPNTELVTGHFLPKVLLKAVPSGLVMFFGVAIMAFGYFFFTPTVVRTLSVYALAAAGFILVFRLCRPFNLFRGLLFGFVLLLFLAAIIFLPEPFLLASLSIKALFVLLGVIVIEGLLTFLLNHKTVAVSLRDKVMSVYRKLERIKWLNSEKN